MSEAKSLSRDKAHISAFPACTNSAEISRCLEAPQFCRPEKRKFLRLNGGKDFLCEVIDSAAELSQGQRIGRDSAA